MTKLEKAYEEIRGVAQTLSPVVRQATNGDMVLSAAACLELAAVIAVIGMDANQATRTELVEAFAERLESLTTSEQEGNQ
jgi:hypothetical protein